MTLRRFLALFLIILGGAFLWFAPESLIGIVLIVLGVAIELLGMFLERWP